jgi:hypothetical protein
LIVIVCALPGRTHFDASVAVTTTVGSVVADFELGALGGSVVVLRTPTDGFADLLLSRVAAAPLVVDVCSPLVE